MTSLARSTGNAGALFDISGTVPTNATWDEDIYFMEAGQPYDITELDWKMTFRSGSGDTSAEFTLSTDDGTLVITGDDDNVLRITVTAGTLNSYNGDYVADLAARDAADKVTLWGHGTVTFLPNPVSF